MNLIFCEVDGGLPSFLEPGCKLELFELKFANKAFTQFDIFIKTEVVDHPGFLALLSRLV